MLFRFVCGLALASLLSTFAPQSRVHAQAAASLPPAEAPQVRAWLLRIHEAASRRNFQGTFVVSGGGSVSSARIAHFCEGKNEFERSESLDGQARHVLRHNEQVYNVWPDKRIVVAGQRNLPANFPALLQAGDDRIVDFYDVWMQGIDRVAGHEAEVLFIKPKDDFRYGYRLWADKASGLLLRADVLGHGGEVLETSAFSDVSIDVKPQPDSVLRLIRKLDAYRMLRPVLTPTRLEAEGWTLARPVDGFRQVSCVKRPMDGAAVGQAEAAAEQVLQTIYSDGLTYVSVFIEPYDASRHSSELLASMGPTQTLLKRHGDWWLTIVGDVPVRTLKEFAQRLQRKK